MASAGAASEVQEGYLIVALGGTPPAPSIRKPTSVWLTVWDGDADSDTESDGVMVGLGVPDELALELIDDDTDVLRVPLELTVEDWESVAEVDGVWVLV